MPPSLFELRRAREEKAARQRSDGGTKEERDDRPLLPIAERHVRSKADRFDRPLRDGRVFLNHFPALRTALRDCRSDSNWFQHWDETAYFVPWRHSLRRRAPGWTDGRRYKGAPGTPVAPRTSCSPTTPGTPGTPGTPTTPGAPSLVAATVPLCSWRSKPERWSEGNSCGLPENAVANARHATGRTVWANDPEATAIYGSS
jgi:hypothetical protein